MGWCRGTAGRAGTCYPYEDDSDYAYDPKNDVALENHWVDDVSGYPTMIDPATGYPYGIDPGTGEMFMIIFD